MKKMMLPFILITPLLMGVANVNETTHIFALTNFSIANINSNSVNATKTKRGYLVKANEDYTSTDAFIRFTDLDSEEEVYVRDNKYLAIRYRANFEAGLAMRILSTTGYQTWNDFLFNMSGATTIKSFSNWYTVVFDLSFENAKNIAESSYNSWEAGFYKGISFNITGQQLFQDDGYVYLSSFAFFNNKDEAEEFKGLDYSQNEDKQGPIIDIPYGDGITLYTTAGRKVNYIATYYDEYDDLSGEVEGILSSGALDENGLLVKGEHQVSFTAYDLSNNFSTKTLNLIVGDKDEVAPIINLNTDTIYVLVNSYNLLEIDVYDEVDGKIDYELTYSDGAINSKGQFNEGHHTLTITATDYSFNTATKTIDIIAGYDINPNGLEFIDEGEI